ncbi:hypothetical protein FRC11_003562, partial [Ceratobasidium sp. 423]
MPPKRKTRSGKEVAEAKSAGDEHAEIRDDVSGSARLVPRPSGLTPEDIQAAVSRYQEHVSQLAGTKSKSELQELDEWRLKELP